MLIYTDMICVLQLGGTKIFHLRQTVDWTWTCILSLLLV